MADEVKGEDAFLEGYFNKLYKYLLSSSIRFRNRTYPVQTRRKAQRDDGIQTLQPRRIGSWKAHGGMAEI